jgi:hypothetical protein
VGSFLGLLILPVLIQCPLTIKAKVTFVLLSGPRRFRSLSSLLGVLSDERTVQPLVRCRCQLYMVTILTILHVYVTYGLPLANNLSIYLFAILHSRIIHDNSNFDIHLHYLQ